MAWRIDLFHASSTQVRNVPTNTRFSATLYDMTCWLFPETHLAANVRVTREFAETVAQRADGFIAISESWRLYGVARPYVLFVGIIEPRKNLDVLLEAYGGFPASVHGEFQLVIAGAMGWASPIMVSRLCAPPGEGRYLAYVPEAGLTAFPGSCYIGGRACRGESAPPPELKVFLI